MHKALNIEWLAHSKDLIDFSIPRDNTKSVIKCFLSYCDDFTLSYQDIINKIEVEFCLNKGMGLCIFKHLAYWKMLEIDIKNHKLIHSLSSSRMS